MHTLLHSHFQTETELPHCVFNIRNNCSLQYSLHDNEQLSHPDHSKFAEVLFICARNHIILDTEH